MGKLIGNAMLEGLTGTTQEADLDIIRGPWFKKVRLRTNTMGRVSIQSGRGVIRNRRRAVRSARV
jgi:hypothetical protein